MLPFQNMLAQRLQGSQPQSVGMPRPMPVGGGTMPAWGSNPPVANPIMMPPQPVGMPPNPQPNPGGPQMPVGMGGEVQGGMPTQAMPQQAQGFMQPQNMLRQRLGMVGY
jgi:hypothetical protein